MTTKNFLGFVSVFVLCASTVALAAAVDYQHGQTWVRLEDWADDGSVDPANVAVTVVDFGEESFAWGYKWTGTAFGADMILALDAQTGLDATYTDWGGDLGVAVNEIRYDGYVATSDWETSFLGYWGSPDGLAWTTHSAGVSSRALTDGDWDGWSIEDNLETYTPENPPQTPAPEPATLALLGAGGGLLVRRRCRW